jgi:hypothetical protein
MNKKNILICGLPASGKTTFIAALWYLLSNREISTALKLGSLPEERIYLVPGMKARKLQQISAMPS